MRHTDPFYALYQRNQAIRAAYPHVVTIRGNDSFDNDGNPVTVDEAKVQAEIVKLESEYQVNEYQRQRAGEYLPLGEQLDMLYWDKKNGTNLWEQHIEAVKAKYPKS